MFKVMQRRCPQGWAASHSETAAERSAVKEQRRTSPPVNRERKDPTQQTPNAGVCCLAAKRNGPRMPRPLSARSQPARSACGSSSAAATGVVPALRGDGRRNPLRGHRGERHVGRSACFAARRPTVVTAARSAAPAASGSFLRQGL
jgi:hypothetical protein